MTVMRKGQVSLFYTPLRKTNPVFSVLTKEVLNKNIHQMGTQKKKSTMSLMKTFYEHMEIRTEIFNTLDQSVHMGYV